MNTMVGQTKTTLCTMGVYTLVVTNCHEYGEEVFLCENNKVVLPACEAGSPTEAENASNMLFMKFLIREYEWTEEDQEEEDARMEAYYEMS